MDDQPLLEENRRLRAEIEESQEQIRKLIGLKITFQNRLRDGLVVLSKSGKIIDANPAFSELTGIPPNALIGRSADQLMRAMMPAESYNAHADSLAAWRKTSHPIRFDLDYNGRILEIENFPALVNDDLFVALVRDVTGERKVSRENAEIQERYRKLAELSTDLIFILDRDEVVNYVNPAAAGYFGKKPEDLIGQPQGALFPGPAGARHAAAIRGVFATGQVFKRDSVDEFIFGPVWLDVRLIPLSAPDGTVQQVMGICRDITDRKKHEEVLRFSQAAMDSATEIILWVRDDGAVTYANAAAARLLGYAPEELKAMSLCDLDPEASPALWKRLWDARKEKGRLPSESALKTRDGRLVPLETSYSVIAFGDREYACVFARDISDHKFAEEELLKAIRIRDEFLANMSHEIRTPMTPILGYTELLLETHLTENQLKYITTIRSSTENLLALLNNLIDLARLEAGQFEMVQDEFGVRELLQEVRQSMADKARRKKLKFTTVMAPSERDLRVVTDRSCLRQVLTVLLSNAVKFTETGGVALSAAVDPEDRWLSIGVSDTGIGIPPQIREAIFDKFYQGDPSTTRRHGGNGLGLPIARSLVRILGGRIAVDSQEGKGSTFTLTIPLVRARGKQARSESTWVRAAGKAFRILVAEDDEATRLVLRSILTQAGLEAVPVSGASEAVERCREDGEISAVLMDLHLKDRDGCEAAREIIAARPGLPVIVLTAAALEKERARCLQAGCAAFVTKPFRTEQLLAVLSSVLKAGTPEA